MSMNAKRIYFILPSLRISGGVIEAVKFGQKLNESGFFVEFISMWSADNKITNNSLNIKSLTSFSPKVIFALPQLLVIVIKFFYYLVKNNIRRDYFVMTHYVTAIFALFIPSSRRVFFVQDLEWEFVNNIILKNILRITLLKIYKSSKIVVANKYLFDKLSGCGIRDLSIYPIWSDGEFRQYESNTKDIDVLFILRKGHHKKIDMYLKANEIFKENKLKVVAITTDDVIFQKTKNLISEIHTRPSRSEIKRLYNRSTFFLLLSEHEGFALPPLEAMGAGCVPICRDSGGPQAYMVNELEEFLFPLDCSIQKICESLIELKNKPIALKCLSDISRSNFDVGLIDSLRVRNNFCVNSSFFFE